jgi:hypothetical protein
LKLDENGYLDAVVRDVHVKFGDSKFYHSNWILRIVMHQIIYYSIIVLENSVYFVGKWLFSSMLGPTIDRYLNHYQLPLNLPSPFPGQTSVATFNLDLRNTADPFIG